MENDFYLIETHPMHMGCSIKKYEEGKGFDEIYKDFELSRGIFKRTMIKEIKQHLKGLEGEHVFFVPSKTREEFWSFEKLIDKGYFDGHMVNEFDVYKIHEDHHYHITDEVVSTLKLEEYFPLKKKDAKKIIKFFKENILK